MVEACTWQRITMTTTSNLIKVELPIIIITKRYNVFIKIRKDEKRVIVTLLVSSKALSLTSEVLKAMFINGFARGKNRSFASLLEASLSGVNPARITVMCKTMHLRTVDILNRHQADNFAASDLLCNR
jgi:hypothetical protein